MKFSARAEYGIRALVELAAHYKDEAPLKLQIIAQRQNISVKFLEQLFIPLRKAGLIRGSRGPIGGYRLARSPQQIRVKEIAEILDEPACTSADQDRSLQQEASEPQTSLICELQAKITHAIREVLASITLEDLRQRQTNLLLSGFPTRLSSSPSRELH